MDLEEQKKIWRQEQLEVASQVEVLDDPLEETDSTPRFRSIPLHPCTMNPANTVQPIYYGGVDVSFPANEADPAVAVYVILEYPSNKVVYQSHEYFHLQVPYIPSYLAFREIDPLERLINKQKKEQPNLTPRAILVDGNGILHPRQAGIACFVGVRTSIPTIGVGKTLFYEGNLRKKLVLRGLEESLQDAKDFFLDNNEDGKQKSSDVVIFDRQTIPKQKTVAADIDDTYQYADTDRGILVHEMAIVCSGLAVPLTNDEGATLACALVGHGGRIGSKQHGKKRGTKNPIYISIGHMVSLLESVQICAALSYAKIPEPVRQADLVGRDLLRVKEQPGGQ